MKRLMKVFEGISDSAISEYFEENTKDYNAVDNYALNALDINLTKDEAMFLLSMLLLDKKINNSNDRFHYIEKKIDEYEGNDPEEKNNENA